MDGFSVRERALLLVRDLIHDRLGIHYDDQKLDLLEDKLAPILAERGMGSLLDYYYLLKYDAEERAVWDELAGTLTVNETYFWRELDQLRAAAQVIVPSLLEEKPSVRIWHAGCASGEECYSLAMMLADRGIRQRVHILGTDLDAQVLERARAARYESRSFRAIPLDERDRHFDREGTRWRLHEDIRGRVHFRQVNLADRDAVAALGRFDVIFCRNVFIYFSHEVTERVVGCFHERLHAPGWLFLGASETLLKVSSPFHLIEVGHAFVYQKRRS
jgi:chemotaxis protein methyltransferase CheR